MALARCPVGRTGLRSLAVARGASLRSACSEAGDHGHRNVARGRLTQLHALDREDGVALSPVLLTSLTRLMRLR